MSTALAPTVIAELAVEWTTPNFDQTEGVDSSIPPARFARPAGVRADNDGVAHHWMRLGRAYQLHHDGVGWQIQRYDAMTGQSHPLFGAHIYRLADASQPKDSFISWLPTAEGGRVELDPAKMYRIGWDSVEDLSHPPQRSRTALLLTELD